MLCFNAAFLACTAFAGLANAAAPAPPVMASVTDGVNVTSNNPPSGSQYQRDAGWLGIIGSRVFVMNFDTSLCNEDETTNCRIVGSNSLTDTTSNPAVVSDPPDNRNLCNTDTQNGWVTNVWGVNNTHGVGVYLNVTHNHTSGEEWERQSAPVIFDVSSKAPVCTRINGGVAFWDLDVNLAAYGNGGTITSTDGHLYLYANQDNNMYLARVPFNVNDVSDLSSYTYWDGNNFVADESKAAVIMVVQGGSIFYSNYLEKYVWLTEGVGYSGVYAYVADAPQGPFSTETLLFTDVARGGTYAPSALTNYDSTGKTVAIVYSVPDNLSQKVRTVTWA